MQGRGGYPVALDYSMMTGGGSILYVAMYTADVGRIRYDLRSEVGRRWREGVGVGVGVNVSEQEKAERSRQDGNVRVTRPGTKLQAVSYVMYVCRW
jgi:hypothetical protein